MRRLLAGLLVVVLAATACSENEPGATTWGRDDQLSSPASQERRGISVVTDARIYTMNPSAPWAEAMAWDSSGMLLAVGTESEVMRAVTGADNYSGRVLPLDGAMVLPGFGDPHVHVPEAGLNSTMCFLRGSDLATLEDRAASCAVAQPGTEWVRAAGVSLFDLRDTDELPIDVLDRAIPNRPALILDDLGHAVWTNSLGLAAAGISPNDPDPQGGVFHRSDSTGELTGLLLEDAQQLVRNAAVHTDAEIDKALQDSFAQLNRAGITLVSDAGGYWMQKHPAAWQRALEMQTMTVRASNSLYVYPDLDVDEQIAEFEQRFGNDSDWLRFDTAKVYIDGILDLGTALLNEPYDRPVDPNYPRGFTYFEPNQLSRYVNELHLLGYRINFHTIGDAAVSTALDAVETIDDDRATVADRRHRTTHTYMVAPADLPRFAELGVVADLQHGVGAVDPLYHEDLFEIIGDRAFSLIPTGALVTAGADIALSSDWDADLLPPLQSIERSLMRRVNPLPDLAFALQTYTLGNAYALGFDDLVGSLETGKRADFIVLDNDLFDIPVDEIGDTNIIGTYVDGTRVWSAAGG